MRKGCREPASRWLTNTAHYCGKHARFAGMRYRAASCGKEVPSAEDLERMLRNLDGFRCPVCSVEMVWYSGGNREARAKVVSLQHWDDGHMGLICHRCNSIHGPATLGDRHFSLDPQHRYCGGCGEVLHQEEFNRGRSQGRQQWCRKCMGRYLAAYRAKKRLQRIYDSLGPCSVEEN